jgi:hypothetical protein
MIQQLMCEYTAEKCVDFDERYDINKACSFAAQTILVPEEIELWRFISQRPITKKEAIVILNDLCVEGTEVEITCPPTNRKTNRRKTCTCFKFAVGEEEGCIDNIDKWCQYIQIIGPEPSKVEASRQIILAKLFSGLMWRGVCRI